jgi:hypothetical protein
MSTIEMGAILAMEVEVHAPTVVKGRNVSPVGGDGLRMSGNEW